VLAAYSAIGDDGHWHRYVEYPELGCLAEGEQTIEAMQDLEKMRMRLITDRYQRGEEIPVPRPPLRSLERAIVARRPGEPPHAPEDK